MSAHPSAGTKLHRILGKFAAGFKLNRFQAELLGDHVLPSTVHALKQRHGLNFERTVEVVPGYGDSRVRTVRYSLSPQEQRRARALLGRP